MTHEAILFLNDTHRMAESLIKLIEAAKENPEIPHNYMLMAQGIEGIKEGMDLVVQSLATN